MVDWQNLGPTGINQAKMRFFVIFLSLDHRFSLKLHTITARDNVEHPVEVKLTKKVWELKFGPHGPKSGPRLVFLGIFSGLVY